MEVDNKKKTRGVCVAVVADATCFLSCIDEMFYVIGRERESQYSQIHGAKNNILHLIYFMFLSRVIQRYTAEQKKMSHISRSDSAIKRRICQLFLFLSLSLSGLFRRWCASSMTASQCIRHRVMYGWVGLFVPKMRCVGNAMYINIAFS